MAITLTGVNSFLLSQELARRVGIFLTEEDQFALERLDGEETSYDRIQEALTSLPFLANKKMVLLRSPSSSNKFIENFEHLIHELPETTELIIVEPKLDKRSKYYKLLKKLTDFHEFGELEGSDLSRWLVTAAKAEGGSLSLAAAQYLIERVGANQQRLASELTKLRLYDSTISRETITLLTEATPQSTIFQLLEAAFAGNKARALELYHEQRLLKVEPPQIIAMLVWQLHLIALVKAAGNRNPDQIARDAKLNPYVIKKSSGIASKLNPRIIRQLINDLTRIDVRSKSQAIDTDEVLQHFLLTLREG